MAWHKVGKGLYGGDAPLDAYGLAVARAAERFDAELGRKPLLAELVRAFDQSAPPGPSPSFEVLQRGVQGDEPPFVQPRKVLTGEVLAIPYAEGKAVVGLVLFGEECEGGPGHGACVLALDLEVAELHDLDQARTAPWLLRPCHPSEPASFERLGRVDLEPHPSFLPCYRWYVQPNGTRRSLEPFLDYQPVLHDYFGEEVPDDAAHRARTVPPSWGGSPVTAIRAIRGLNAPLPWDSHQPWPGGPHPLAHLPPFDAPLVDTRDRPPEAPPRGEPTEALLRELATILEEAAAECESAWQARWDRAPVREELARALILSLSVRAEKVLADPGRGQRLAVPGPRRRPKKQATRTFEWFDRDGAVQVLVSEPDGDKWSAFPRFDGGEATVDVIGQPLDVAEFVLAELLPAWREREDAPPPGVDIVIRPMTWGEPFAVRG